jgi:hypothetical protein
MNPAEPGHPAQPLKVGTNLTGELTVAPYGGELKARFVQPAGVGVAVGVRVGVLVEVGVAMVVGFGVGVEVEPTVKVIDAPAPPICATALVQSVGSIVYVPGDNDTTVFDEPAVPSK